MEHWKASLWINTVLLDALGLQRHFSVCGACQLCFEQQQLTEYVQYIFSGNRVFIIWLIKDLPYPDICDIKENQEKSNFLEQDTFLLNANKCSLLLARKKKMSSGINRVTRASSVEPVWKCWPASESVCLFSSVPHTMTLQWLLPSNYIC